MIKSIRMIGMSALAAGLGLLVTPVARAQDSVFVTTTGDVGIGTSTPTTRDVHANTTSKATIRLRNANANGYPGIEYMDESGVVNLFFGLDNAANMTRLNRNEVPGEQLEGRERDRFGRGVLAINDFGASALAYAALRGECRTIQVLLDAGASLDVRPHGVSLLEFAGRGDGDFKTRRHFELLRAAGAS
ncbi:MAG: hypothetical protein ACJ75H_15265 [Thermoanaerobaculia bacterium]